MSANTKLKLSSVFCFLLSCPSSQYNSQQTQPLQNKQTNKQNAKCFLTSFFQSFFLLLLLSSQQTRIYSSPKQPPPTSPNSAVNSPSLLPPPLRAPNTAWPAPSPRRCFRVSLSRRQGAGARRNQRETWRAGDDPSSRPFHQCECQEVDRRYGGDRYPSQQRRRYPWRRHRDGG